MLFPGIILFLLGAVSAIFGITKNNDVEAQLEYFWEKGKTNPGSTFIIIGVLLMLAGAAIIVYRRYSSEKNNRYWYEKENIKRKSESVQHEKDLLMNGGWKCVCGAVNAPYVFTCSCGKSKREANAITTDKNVNEEKANHSLHAQLTELHLLHEQGLITDAEYEAKRKQVINI